MLKLKVEIVDFKTTVRYPSTQLFTPLPAADSKIWMILRKQCMFDEVVNCEGDGERTFDYRKKFFTLIIFETEW